MQHTESKDMIKTTILTFCARPVVTCEYMHSFMYECIRFIMTKL